MRPFITITPYTVSTQSTSRTRYRGHLRGISGFQTQQVSSSPQTLRSNLLSSMVAYLQSLHETNPALLSLTLVCDSVRYFVRTGELQQSQIPVPIPNYEVLRANPLPIAYWNPVLKEIVHDQCYTPAEPQHPAS